MLFQKKDPSRRTGPGRPRFSKRKARTKSGLRLMTNPTMPHTGLQNHLKQACFLIAEWINRGGYVSQEGINRSHCDFEHPVNARKDLCRAAGSAPSNPIFLACRSLSASPSQHSCFGIPLKAQHCCPFYRFMCRGRADPRGSRWSHRVCFINCFISLQELCQRSEGSFNCLFCLFVISF